MIIKELNIEVEDERHSLGKSFNELKIPKGWRLLTLNEMVWLINSKYAKKLHLVYEGGWWGEFVVQPFKKNEGFAAWVGCYSDLLNFSTINYLDYSYAARGVRYCKKIKYKK